MAEEEKQESTQESPEKESTGSSGTGMMTWIIIGAIFIAGCIGGLSLAMLIGGSDPQTAGAEPEPQSNLPQPKSFEELYATTQQDAKPWYLPLDAVVANLDEPGVTRYLRAAVTLEISAEIDPEEGAKYLDDNKKLILRDWLTTYIAGLSLEDVRGTKNLGRIKKQIREQFNELLFPGSKPHITNVFLKEFAIQ
jgi:flagellar basal body-associated protein FliL